MRREPRHVHVRGNPLDDMPDCLFRDTVSPECQFRKLSAPQLTAGQHRQNRSIALPGEGLAVGDLQERRMREEGCVMTRRLLFRQEFAV
jgi:hypothetical protein